MFISAALAAALSGLLVDHTAWDIREVAETFAKHPGAQRVRYVRDTPKTDGEIIVTEADGSPRRAVIPAGSSPVGVPGGVQVSGAVVAKYPKTYSRAEIRKLVEALKRGDGRVIPEPHETLGLITRHGRIRFVLELTGDQYADKPLAAKIRIVDEK